MQTISTTAKQQPVTPAVSDHPYRQIHATTPRGRASWAFCPENRWTGENYLEHTKWFRGTYGVARQAAKRAFKGETTIVCLP
jgi:hypothetical protein